jgi:hypothetical protein
LVGEIGRTDKATNSLELLSRQEANGRPDISAGRPQGTVTIGRTAPQGEKRIPGLPPAPTDLRTDRSTDDRDEENISRMLRTTVFLTDRTVCKERDKVLLCGLLRTSDRVRVTGEERSEPRGRGLYATEIVRNPIL